MQFPCVEIEESIYGLKVPVAIIYNPCSPCLEDDESNVILYKNACMDFCDAAYVLCRMRRVPSLEEEVKDCLGQV